MFNKFNLYVSSMIYKSLSQFSSSKPLINKLNNMCDLKNIFLKSVEAVNPAKLIRNSVKISNNILHVCGDNYEIKNKCVIVGFGKAVLPMATELEEVLGDKLTTGIVSIPTGILSSNADRQMATSTKIKYMEGAKDNLPDNAAENATKEIVNLIRPLERDDLLIILVSGGGSALLPLPISPITLEEKCQLIKNLSTRGADILELNCVRKRLSQSKGGGLAVLSYPATVVTMILSDIIGDPLDCIASGPTLPNKDDPEAAMKIIEKYSLLENLPESIKTVLCSEVADKSTEIPKNNGSFAHVKNYIIGNNTLASKAAEMEATRLGYQSVVISVSISGDVAMISETYTQIALELAKYVKGVSSKEILRECFNQARKVLTISDEAFQEVINLEYKYQRGVCIIAGGEPTVAVKGNGKGGRNQQLALQFSVDIAKAIENDIKDINISFLSAGTDGIDGPTDAAGAIGFSALFTRAKLQNLDPVLYLQNNDSFNFYSKFDDGKYLIRTGHTGTNVMDIHVIMIKMNT